MALIQTLTTANDVQVLEPQLERDPSKFLDFKTNKVQVLTMEQLRKTAHEDNAATGQPLKGLYHFDLIDQITDKARHYGYDVDIYDLFAANNRDSQHPGVTVLNDIEAQLGEQAVEAHILRRVYANIRLKDFDDDELTTNLAISYHQGGIQVGFGNMVKICHNQCMLGIGSHYATTYKDKRHGSDGMEIAQILDLVGTWFSEAQNKVITERERMARMKEMVVSENKCLEFIGRLNALRVVCDTSIKRIHANLSYPLNQAQITKFTEAMLCAYTDNDRVSVWDLYNAATEMYKPGQTDIPLIMPQNIRLTELLAEEFGA